MPFHAKVIRLTRAHAPEWHLDPNPIGAIGFSAGAHLAAVFSTHPEFRGSQIPESTVDAVPGRSPRRPDAELTTALKQVGSIEHPVAKASTSQEKAALVEPSAAMTG